MKQNMSIPVLRLRGLAKAYAPGRPLIAGIDLELQAGDYLAILGESGVGKSTLLNLIAGLDTSDGGSVEIGGTDMGPLSDRERTLIRRRAIGFVFQAFHLIPHLTVFQNILLPLALNNCEDREDRIGELLEAVGLREKRDALPGRLSGGEMQRVAIARALAHRPALLLADEPTGNLDQENARQVLQLLRDQVKQSGGAGLLVTHSEAAAASADRMLVLTPTGLISRP
jgi:putative ABC transport system ATP-binding protein